MVCEGWPGGGRCKELPFVHEFLAPEVTSGRSCVHKGKEESMEQSHLWGAAFPCLEGNNQGMLIILVCKYSPYNEELLWLVQCLPVSIFRAAWGSQSETLLLGVAEKVGKIGRFLPSKDYCWDFDGSLSALQLIDCQFQLAPLLPSLS